MAYCDEYIENKQPLEHAKCEAWWWANKVQNPTLFPPQYRLSWDNPYTKEQVGLTINAYIIAVKNNRIPEWNLEPNKQKVILDFLVTQLPLIKRIDIGIILNELYKSCIGDENEPDRAKSFPCILKPKTVPDCYANTTENNRILEYIELEKDEGNKGVLAEASDLLQTVLIAGVIGVGLYFLVKFT